MSSNKYEDESSSKGEKNDQLLNITGGNENESVLREEISDVDIDHEDGSDSNEFLLDEKGTKMTNTDIVSTLIKMKQTLTDLSRIVLKEKE